MLAGEAKFGPNNTDKTSAMIPFVPTYIRDRVRSLALIRVLATREVPPCTVARLTPRLPAAAALITGVFNYTSQL